MFLTLIFSIFFRKLDGASPVAPKTIGIISNVKLGYNLFSSDNNCIIVMFQVDIFPNVNIKANCNVSYVTFIFCFVPVHNIGFVMF